MDRPMDPSEVRARVLADHETIRGVLDRLAALALQAPDDPEVAATLRAELTDFLPRLEAHMDLEDRILVPALQELDAFGDVRTDMMHAHHAHYRAELDAMMRDLEAGGVEQLVAWTDTLVTDVRAEMADEERRLLDPDLLKDDLVTSGIGG